MTPMIPFAVGVFFCGWGYLHHRWPAYMYRFQNFPFAPQTPVGENARTQYRRRGLFYAAFGALFLLWSLLEI